ncbi:hypothetical protein [Rickettsiella endosymbiont of Rhagonycha lignosa]|uniref:hypothetical protein n=1 Tax=Rickettsiella endosymbiont of Rhagonycha lignosa TaxID=3077937 RepID=UPI00313D8716
MTLKTSVGFAIPGPSPVGTVFTPQSYSDWNMRQVLGTITSTVGQLNFTFLTNLRLDESKAGRVTSVTPQTIMSGGAMFSLEFGPPTQTYQPQNTAGYNWLITAILFLKNSAGATVDFPAGGISDLSIDIEWDCKGSE